MIAFSHIFLQKAISNAHMLYQFQGIVNSNLLRCYFLENIVKNISLQMRPVAIFFHSIQEQALGSENQELLKLWLSYLIAT